MTQTPHAHAPVPAGGLSAVIDTNALRAAVARDLQGPLQSQVLTLANGYDALLQEQQDHRTTIMHQHTYLTGLRNHLEAVQEVINRWVAEEEGV